MRDDPVFLIEQAAKIVGRSPRRLQMKAKSEGAVRKPQSIDWFPLDWQPALWAWWQSQQPEPAPLPEVQPAEPAPKTLPEIAQALVAPVESSSVMHCRSELIHALDVFVEQCKQNDNIATNCWSLFRAAYNRGEIAVSPETLQQYPPGQCPAPSTILRWRTQKQTEGLNALLPGKNGRDGMGLIRSNPEIKEAVDGAIAYTGIHATPKRVWQLLTTYRQVPGIEGISLAQVQRYLTYLQKREPVYWLNLTDPKAARNKTAVAFGSRSLGLQPCDLVEIDFTRNDVILVGPKGRKRYALGMAVDVATRRCQILITEVPKGEATALLIFKCLKAWGQIKTLRPDNGKEFINQRVSGLCAALSIYIDPCVPGKPMEKPHVERLIGTFNHDLITLLPSYVGKNVLERQALRASKGEKETLELAMELDQFQQFADRWARDYETRQHSGLNCSPLERLAQFTAEGWLKHPVAVPEEALAVLALPRKKCRVQRGDGVRLLNRKYLSAELGAWIDLDVMVLYDPDEPMSVRVFSLDMKQMICVAKWDTTLTAEEMAVLTAKAKKLQKGLTEGIAGAKKEASKIRKEVVQNSEKLMGEGAEVMPMERLAKAVTAPVMEALTPAPEPKVIHLHERRKATPDPVEVEEVKPSAGEILKSMEKEEEALSDRCYQIFTKQLYLPLQNLIFGFDTSLDPLEPWRAMSSDDQYFYLFHWFEFGRCQAKGFLPDELMEEIDRLARELEKRVQEKVSANG